MTNNQLESMTTTELLSAFINKAYCSSCEAISDRILTKLKDRLTDSDFKELNLEYMDSKSLIGNKETLMHIIKDLRQKYK